MSEGASVVEQDPSVAKPPTEVKVSQDKANKGLLRRLNLKQFFADKANLRTRQEIEKSIKPLEDQRLREAFSKSPEIKDKLISVLQQSESIRNSVLLRQRAIDLLTNGVSESAITEVMERGLAASPEAIDEVYEKGIKEAVKKGDFGFLRSINVGTDVLEILFKLEDSGLPRKAVASLIENTQSFSDFKKFDKLSYEDIVKIFPEYLKTGPIDSPSFQNDIKEFLISRRRSSLDAFFQRFPQYSGHRAEEIKRNIPDYIEFYRSHSGNEELEIGFGRNAFDKFVYRGEGSAYRIAEGVRGETDIINLLDTFKKQGGLGKINSTYVAPHPDTVKTYTASDGGIWVIKKEILEKVPTANLHRNGEVNLRGIVPFEYVEKLLVTENKRKEILDKYGEENTELFGRPLKDVVMVGFDPDRITYSDLFFRTVLDLNLQKSEDKN